MAFVHFKVWKDAVRFMLVGAFLLVTDAALPQADLWEHFVIKEGPPFRDVTLSAAQTRSIQLLIKSRAALKEAWCEEENGDWWTQLGFRGVELGSAANVILVEGEADCAHGAQGANGVMWLVRFEGNRPVLLASPEGSFSGWFYETVPISSRGYRDIVAPNYKTVNVETESADHDSLLRWYKKLIAPRQTKPALHSGGMMLLNKDDAHVLCYVRKAPQGGLPVVVALNMSGQSRTVALDFSKVGIAARSLQVLAATDSSVRGKALSSSLTLSPFAVLVAAVR